VALQESLHLNLFLEIGDAEHFLCLSREILGSYLTIVCQRLHGMFIKGKGKAIPVIGRGGPYGCETLRFPHFLDNWPTDGGKVASPMHRPPCTPQEDSWYSFLLEAVDLMAIVWLEGLDKFKRSTSSGLNPATFRLVA
jgi:hypothetical protein